MLTNDTIATVPAIVSDVPPVDAHTATLAQSAAMPDVNADVPADKPVKAKRASKPRAVKPVVPVVVAPVTVAKPRPDNAAKLAAAAKLAERRTADRRLSRTVYNGASPVIHARDPLAFDAYAAVVREPVQRIGKSGPTERDESALHTLATRGDKSGTFCPVALAFDRGALSRLASGGFVSLTGDTFALTPTGAERARGIAKRLAPAKPVAKRA